MEESKIKYGALRFGEFYALEDDLSAVKHINGSSLTIPGQARDLGALLAASKFSGGMIPIHGTPQFDESFEHGLARVQVDSMDEDDLSRIAIEAVEKEKKEKEPATPTPEPSNDVDGE